MLQLLQLALQHHPCYVIVADLIASNIACVAPLVSFLTCDNCCPLLLHCLHKFQCKLKLSGLRASSDVWSVSV